jgi:transcription antitermination factor NusG
MCRRRERDSDGPRDFKKNIGHVAHRAKLCADPIASAVVTEVNTQVVTLQCMETREDPGAAWCAVYTRHQHEKSVGETLKAKGFEVFLPLYDSTRRWKDRQKVLSLPLFPCYVFVRGAIDRRLPVLTTPGVHMIISCGERVATIPEEEIEGIRRTVEGPFRVEPHPFLRCGERVRVVRGSLEGVEGVLTRKKNLYRLVLSVDMLAQSVAVEIDALDVVPVLQRNVVAVQPGKADFPQHSSLAGD